MLYFVLGYKQTAIIFVFMLQMTEQWTAIIAEDESSYPAPQVDNYEDLYVKRKQKINILVEVIASVYKFTQAIAMIFAAFSYSTWNFRSQ